jgi:adenylate cyclase
VEGERARRRLAAIVAADVVGYSRLVGADEEGTLARLKALRREVVDPRLARHSGRIVKTTGDGLLMEFASAVDAVRCVLDLQRAVAAGEESRPEKRRLCFRIGVNVGDIVVDGEDILGDGVNVAARLEQLAEPGGICLSGRAYEDVRGRLELDIQDIGEHSLKNIDRPVRVFRLAVHAEGAAPAHPALALPDKPSIAVLPFQNMSGDAEQEYFCDGLVEEVITALSRFHWLFVIARNSSFTYKGRSVDVKRVSRELGVRYVLEGSVRKSGQKVRITGQLIDGTTGAHIWADRFDGTLEDIFDLQDQVTISVVGAVEPQLKSTEIDRSRRKAPESLDSYDLYLQSLPHFDSLTRNGNGEALRLLYLAIEKDPTFALVRAKAASCYSQRLNSGWIEDLDAERAEAIRLARSALALDKNDAEVLADAAAIAARFSRDLDEALMLIGRALSRNSNLAYAWAISAFVHNASGNLPIGLAHGEQALRLSPSGSQRFFYLGMIGISHFFSGHFDVAVHWFTQSVRENPNFPSSHSFLGAALAHLGRLEEARVSVRRRQEMDPKFTIEGLRKRLTYRPEQAQLYLDGLRKAGLPE